MISSRSTPLLTHSLRLASAALLFLPTLAHAHPGHGGIDDGDFAHGLLHPLTGMDHLVTMIAVGLWAVQLGGRALWAVPLSFVTLMAAGGAMGMGGFVPPMVEQGILASVFLLGLALLTARKMPLWASASLTGVFALYHGAAHGAEMPAGSSALAFGVGMIAATAFLHGCGLLAGFALRAEAQRPWLRAAGAAVIAAGAVLALH